MELFSSMPDMVKFIIVFVVILAILVPLLWRRFNVGALGPSGQRGRRLAVIDSAAVDVRRRLVLIKRDNVEHLLMIGGPSDLVVESNITRTPVVREPRPIPDARSEATHHAAAAESPEWSLPLEPMARPVRTVDLDAALPEPPARSAREAMVDSMRAVRSGAAARRSPPMDFDNPPEEIAAPALTPPSGEVHHHRPPQAPEPRRPAAVGPEAQRPSAPEPLPQPPPPSFPPSGDAPEPRRERGAPAASRPVPAAAAPSAVPPSPRPVPPLPAAAGNAPPPPRSVQPSPPTPSDESNLAEMAQRLEAALRRPTKSEPPPPPPVVRPQRRPEPPGGRKNEAAGPAKVSGKSLDSPDLKVLPGRGKNDSTIGSLEDEMAKMLGRPGKS